MTIYVGQLADLAVRGTDGRDKTIIEDATCVVHLFAPPKNPKDRPEDRADPDGTVEAVYDPATRRYWASAVFPVSGTWWMQGVLTGGSRGYHAFDFFSFPVEP